MPTPTSLTLQTLRAERVNIARYIERNEFGSIEDTLNTLIRRISDSLNNYDYDRILQVIQRIYPIPHPLYLCVECGNVIVAYGPWGVMNSENDPICYSCQGDIYRQEEDGAWVRNESYQINDSVMDYCTNPLSIFTGFRKHSAEISTDTTRYLGVELEVECASSTRSLLVRQLRENLNGLAIIKSDGSLDYGFEICSIPATLKYHKHGSANRRDGRQTSPWNGLFNNIEALTNLRADDTSTAGLHVHISRTSLTPLTMAKLMVFVNSSDVTISAFFSDFAQRRPGGRWASFRNLPPSPWEDIMRDAGTKYTMLNLCHADTLEFRMFRATLNKERFFATLEFCHALPSWAAETSLKDINLNSFFEWLTKSQRNVHEYNYLIDWLLRNSYIQENKKAGIKLHHVGGTN